MILVPQFDPGHREFSRAWLGLAWLPLDALHTFLQIFSLCSFFLPFFLHKHGKLQTGARKIGLPRLQHFSNSPFIWPFGSRPEVLSPQVGRLPDNRVQQTWRPGVLCITDGWQALLIQSILSHCCSPKL